MPKIKLLDEALINKIAAGEVIERPASVIKELVENAIDAEADIISVEIEEGGKSKIRVTDNGSGMEKEDALICLKRHATSKISTAEDLFKIKTMGFRGEALASIAAIAELSLKTKTKESSVGFKILVSGGKILDQHETAMPDGTIIKVTNLFFNVPVRKKHLKTIQTELRQIVELMTKFALAYPDKTFRLMHHEQETIFSPAAKTLLDTVLTIYGKKIGYGMIPVKYMMNEITVTGVLSKPTLTRSDKSIQHIFVNTRAIKNPIISKAVYDAYHTLLHLENHPLFILNVEINPEIIDVNVHPQKALIRVEKENELYNAVFNAVRHALDTAQLVPQIAEEKTTTIQAPLIARSFAVTDEKQTFFHDKKQQEGSQETQQPTEVSAQEILERAMQKVCGSDAKQQLTTEAAAVTGTKRISSMKLIGRVHNVFYLAENELGLIIIDQHAAHERVLYEKFMQQFYEGTIPSQELLVPEEIEFSPAEMLLFKEHRKSIERLGFSLEEFGRNTLLLRSVPSILGKLVGKETIHEILAQITDRTMTVHEKKEEKIIRTACRAAVKANDIVHLNEMHGIMQQLQVCKQPFTCPHGRPTMIQFSIPELEKKFKRV
ncbi:MAG: DNA mismatch repair endonuclease MutL, partial [Nanoarchaeota archaeon]